MVFWMVSKELDNDMLSIRLALEDLELHYVNEGGLPILDARLIPAQTEHSYCTEGSLSRGRIKAYQDLWNLRARAKDESGPYGDAFRRQIHSLLYHIYQMLLLPEDRDSGDVFFRNMLHFNFVPCSEERQKKLEKKLIQRMIEAQEAGIRLECDPTAPEIVKQFDFRKMFYHQFSRLEAEAVLPCGQTEFQNYCDDLIRVAKQTTQKLMKREAPLLFNYVLNTYRSETNHFGWLNVIEREFSFGLNLYLFRTDQDECVSRVSRAFATLSAFHEFAGHAPQFIAWIENEQIPRSLCITTNFTPELGGIEGTAEAVSQYMLENYPLETDPKELACFRLYKAYYAYDRCMKSHVFDALQKGGESVAMDKFYELFPGQKSDYEIIKVNLRNVTVDPNAKHATPLVGVIINFVDSVRDELGDQKYADFLGDLLNNYCDGHTLVEIARKHGYKGKILDLTDDLAVLPDPEQLMQSALCD